MSSGSRAIGVCQAAEVLRVIETPIVCPPRRWLTEGGSHAAGCTFRSELWGDPWIFDTPYLVFWQVTVGNLVPDQSLLERYSFVEEEVFQICWRSEANLRVIEALMSESEQYGGDYKPGSYGPLYAIPECGRFESAALTSDGIGIHIPWSVADTIEASVQSWLAVFGMAVFVVGLVARLWLSS